MTASEFELIALKAGGAVLGLIIFYWVRLMILGIKKK